MCNHDKIVCPRHGGGFDCTPFCNLCEGDQEFCPTCEQMTMEDWENVYLPMENNLNGDCKGNAYETYGDELDYITQQDERNVWTEMDGDNGVYIVNGYHIVNRIQYYITNKPWTNDVTVTVCEYVTCSCYNEDTELGNPECSECNGEGTYTKWNW